jgi:hypothetical protein
MTNRTYIGLECIVHCTITTDKKLDRAVDFTQRRKIGSVGANGQLDFSGNSIDQLNEA